MEQNLVEIRSLVKRYGDFALEQVNLDVPAGYVVGMVGANGAGKTTIIKSLLGLVRPAAGTVRVLGKEPHDDGWRERVGVVFDVCAFPSEVRVADVARIGKSAYTNWDDAMFWRIAEPLGAGGTKAVKELSRGMSMRLSLAFALAHNPDLLILDEPTAGLDPLARGEILDLLRDYMNAGERGILMATHITTDLEKIADWLVCIDNGRVAFSCPKDDVCSLAGVAHCRQADLDRVLQHGGYEPGALRIIRRAHGVDVLVPDRFAFERLGLDAPCDSASIDDYLEFTLKGETR